MADKLEVFNQALRMCGERRLANLAVTGEAISLLNDVWDGNAVGYMLEQGLWHFAKRTARLDPDPDYVAPFGYRYRFEKPGDWVRTAGICQDEYFNVPLTQVTDEAGSWFADLTPLYVAYISGDPNYGSNLGIWPETFSQAVSGYLAGEIAPKLTAALPRVDSIKKEARKLLIDARSKAAMSESAAFLPTGSWVRARLGGRNGRFDRGSSGRLIG